MEGAVTLMLWNGIFNKICQEDSKLFSGWTQKEV